VPISLPTKMSAPKQPFHNRAESEGKLMWVVSAFQALEDLCNPVTWASARSARSSPGCNIAGLRPWNTGRSTILSWRRHPGIGRRRPFGWRVERPPATASAVPSRGHRVWNFA